VRERGGSLQVVARLTRGLQREVVMFLVGALIGIQVLMRAGMNRERERFLSNDAPTWISAVARFISGLYVHMPDRPARADLYHDADRHPPPSAGPRRRCDTRRSVPGAVHSYWPGPCTRTTIVHRLG
jgi:hypothetical protein